MANQEAEMFKIALQRPNSSVSWGFRLQGGADFSTPLSIQLVQPASVAEQSGLQAGDGIFQINGLATETLDHEMAKMQIIRAGNDIEFLVQRGAVNTWKPKVTPMSELKPSELQTHALPGEAPPMQKTSLSANKQPVQHIGSSHNRSAKPFGMAGGSSVVPESHISISDSFPGRADASNRNQLQQEYLRECGGVVPDVDYDIQPSLRQQQPGGAPSGVVHAQYNTPLGIYSNKNVGDTFQQQASVMKNDFGNMSLHDDQVADQPSVIAQNNNNVSLSTLKQPANQTDIRKSPVQLALEQEDQAEPGLYKGGNIQSKSFRLLEQELVQSDMQSDADTNSSPAAVNRVLPPGVKSVQAPKTNMRMTGPRYKQPTTKCYVCGNFISGVFVRVKEHCLHAQCLKCAQCNRNLKNIGYIWVKDKIYCVQHARELTRPPGGGYTAYVIDAPEGV